MKRWASLFIVFYCLRSDGTYLRYEGMSQGDVITITTQQGQSCTFITADQYNTYISTSSAATQAALSSQQTALSPFQIEFATTTASLLGHTTGYVGSSVINQQGINAKVARIQELRTLLGI